MLLFLYYFSCGFAFCYVHRKMFYVRLKHVKLVAKRNRFCLNAHKMPARYLRPEFNNDVTMAIQRDRIGRAGMPVRFYTQAL